MKDKILTISIAAYNMEKYISETLESLILKEVLDDIEVFIIDDGSTDQTLSIAQEYAKKYPDTFYPIHKENGGWGSTVNYSIQHSSGKYFTLLDGDDLFYKPSLKILINYLKECKSDVMVCPYYIFYDGNKEYKLCNEHLNQSCGQPLFLKDIDYKEHFSMPSLFFRTDILKHNNVKLLEHCFYTDTEFVAKGLLYSNTIIFYNVPVYCYRMARIGHSCSKNGFKKHYKEHFSVIEELIKLPNNNFVFNKINELTGRHYLVSTYFDSFNEGKKYFWNFDFWLKQFPDYYSHSKVGHAMFFFRKMPLFGYELARIYYKIRNKCE